MLDTFRKVRDLLDPRQRRQAVLLLGMIIIMALLEMGGVALIVPFVAVLSRPELVETNKVLSAVYNGLGFSTLHAFFLFLGLLVFLVTIGSIAFKALTTWLMLRFVSMRQHTLSFRLFKGFLHQPYVWFLQRHSADLGKTVLSEVGEVIGGTMNPGMQLIAQAAVATALIALLVVADPLLAVAATAIIGGSYASILWLTRKYVSRLGRDRVRANQERYRVSSEALTGIKDVKVVGLEQVFTGRFENPSLRMAKRKAQAQMLAQLPQYALQAIAFGGILLLVQYQIVVHGSLGQALPWIALYALAGQRLLPALQKVYQQTAALRFGKHALDMLHRNLVENRLGAESESDSGRNGRMIRLNHRLELRNIVYHYPKSNLAALDRVNLVIPARSTVGFVGRTGAGKTTIVDVILRLLEPEEGLLLVDGTSITARNQRAWRRAAGYVPQQIFLTDETVAANIAFGIPKGEIDMAAVERAARIANLHDFVTDELPLGYETLIGERGIRLSGGQRQRIGIARALYHDPDVLIMDEATSALDNVTERAVMDAVTNLEHQKTIILVAHRLTTVKRCDEIFVFEHGRVVSSGTYDELAERSEEFQTMVASGM